MSPSTSQKGKKPKSPNQELTPPSLSIPKKRKNTKKNKRNPRQLPPLDEKSITGLEEILGYEFLNKALLEEALTHSTFCIPLEGHKSYERLEFIGDAVLYSVVADHVFFTYGDLQPGQLTKLRSANVDKEKLARITVEHGLEQFLRHKMPVLNDQIKRFIGDIKDYPIHSNGLIDIPKVLSDILESIIGAVYIDSTKNYDVAWKVLTRLTGDSFITPETLGTHPVSELEDFCGSMGLKLKYKEETWARNHTIEVLINKMLMGSATYLFRKQTCRARAAKAALDQLAELREKKGVKEFFMPSNK